ncbi:1-deoxy-D-xylulose-5-phosphate reductoisomerase [Marinimicrobium sp. ABcell2]|uniref:1-deoxy-D-xylulose-5-phosphate reductoisomerase n=1 Tax=Marinimicrobium sp. ABcell2 TaxID=3069751 RepID=UPI0027B15AA5|nr:1-deoxy-D-xylulose-5-phosphate reductoisomerase [Marinimicrobium sp. ABcell2]MDQ2075330.1 1-deoxy-D-xylulose-5-phosphate reductoisomerase [Marinimicrobium sp. ABcell2]
MIPRQAVTVLGATGSIGVSTLDVLARHRDRYSVFALTAHRQWQSLAEQCLEHRPRYAVMGDPGEAQALREVLSLKGSSTEVLQGEEALRYVAGHDETDIVMAAIVGAAGLLPALAAVEGGKKVLLANKEALVMAGGLFTRAVRDHGATLLPIDSEHNAIFQCLQNERADCQAGELAQRGVRRIMLTASGGPFRTRPLSELSQVTPEEACAHPNWSMGQKISVDSATMMNKGLEFIEACWLFNARPEQVEVVVHPQSVIHSLVEYTDGSVLAQMGNPDMRTPIAHALAWPERIESGVASLDLIATARLDFCEPDYQRFPCLSLARQAAETGGTAPALLNAANEIAVAAFLARRIRFDQIALVIERVLERLPVNEPDALDVVQNADLEARTLAQTLIDAL